jgi:hypothetical protein
MTPHHVDSHEHMLSESDIMLVTAHDLKHTAKELWEKASPEIQEAMTPERVLYNYAMTQWNNPGVIRLREGNTLAVIVPETKSAAIVLLHNADKMRNLSTNFFKMYEAAHKMGYRKVRGPLTRKEHGNDIFVSIVKKLGVEHDWSVTTTKDSIEVAF